MTRGTVHHRKKKNTNKRELTQLTLWYHKFGSEFPGGQGETENTISYIFSLSMRGKYSCFLGEPNSYSDP